MCISDWSSDVCSSDLHAERVRGQLGNRVVAFRGVGGAMPAGVHAQHPKAVAKQRDDLVPHRKVGAQRVEQHQGRRACPAIGPPLKPTSLPLGKRNEVPRPANAPKRSAIPLSALFFVTTYFGVGANTLNRY